MVEETAADKLRRLERSRAAHKGVATKALGSISTVMSKAPEDVSATELQTLNQAHVTLAGKHADILEGGKLLEELVDDADLEKELEDAATYLAKLQCETEMVAKFIAKVSNPPAAVTPPPAATPAATSSSSSSLRLPQMDLPTFSGEYLQWTPFIDLFNAAVDSNSSITDAQKLQYLKSSLRGDASKVISSLAVTDANYATARTMLQERYENDRAIIAAHLNGMFLATPVRSDSARQLRKLMETFEEHRLILEGKSVVITDAVLTYTLSGKMDNESRREWELSPKDSSQPKYKDMKRFMEQRCRALESVPQKPHHSAPPNATRRLTPKQSYQTSQDICGFCKQGHKTFRCNDYQSASHDQRKEMIKQHQLCYNCYSMGTPPYNAAARQIVRTAIDVITHQSAVHTPLQAMQQAVKLVTPNPSMVSAASHWGKCSRFYYKLLKYTSGEMMDLRSSFEHFWILDPK